jgi:hypothetical protein
VSLSTVVASTGQVGQVISRGHRGSIGVAEPRTALFDLRYEDGEDVLDAVTGAEDASVLDSSA